MIIKIKLPKFLRPCDKEFIKAHVKWMRADLVTPIKNPKPFNKAI